MRPIRVERLVELVEALGDYPLVRGVVYFNSRNPEVSVTPDRPDWSLSASEIELLRAAILSAAWFEPEPAGGPR